MTPNNPPEASCAVSATRWTLVIRARGQSSEARAALAELCDAYYSVVENFIRRQTGDAQSTRDLAHEFFARVLAGPGLGGADRARGRFRSYLFGAVKHFLSVECARQLALKRGGHASHVPLDVPADDTSPGLELADAAAESPDAAFDRQWATAMLSRSLQRLGADMVAEGKGRQFEVLKPCLQAGGMVLDHGQLAAELGMNANALKVAIHRLRKRFRDVVKREIADTLHDPSLVDEEMQHLISALGSTEG